MERLGDTLRLLSMIPRRPGEEPIPLQPGDVLADALALVAQHREVRDVEFAVETAPDLPPVLCPETALVHALLALLAGAGTAARERGAARVAVRCTGDERRVTVEVEPEGGAAGGGMDAAGLTALIAAAGGEAEAVGSGIAARLPTLLAGRSPRPT
jgi:C4-dicarboxylate-specific signal transduction histidine kinase